MNYLEWETVDEILLNLANRVKKIRKRRKITQRQLAVMSDVSFGSIKRFETTGQISLESLVKISRVLNCVEQIKELFNNVTYLSIEEVIDENN